MHHASRLWRNGGLSLVDGYICCRRPHESEAGIVQVQFTNYRKFELSGGGTNVKSTKFARISEDKGLIKSSSNRDA